MDINTNKDIFRKTIVVKKEHLDSREHVNNAVYLQWIQEIASEHWLSKYSNVPDEEAYWVVLEHHIVYRQQAYLDDLLTVETFVEPPQGVRFPRLVNFYRNKSLIVNAKTLWCWINTLTKRPQRVPEHILSKFLH